MARWELETEVRGTAVTVKAEAFGEDRSVGIPWGPDEVWAETPDGTVFELTEEEAEEFGTRAAEETWMNLDRCEA